MTLRCTHKACLPDQEQVRWHDMSRDPRRAVHWEVQIRTGFRQGCLLSPFLFLLAIVWVMRRTTGQRRSGIQLTPWKQLDYLDFADNLTLLSHTHQQMQDKITRLTGISSQVGLTIHKKKTKIMRLDATREEPAFLAGTPLEEVESFTYLRSIIDKKGGTDADVRAIIGKARAAFLQLNKCVEFQRAVTTQQSLDFQLKHKIRYSIWSRDLEVDKNHSQQITDLHKQLS